MLEHCETWTFFDSKELRPFTETISVLSYYKAPQLFSAPEMQEV